jgi:alpha-L-rhamnosidase
MNMKKNISNYTLMAAVVAGTLLSCSDASKQDAPNVGVRTEALSTESWEQSQWIAAANAPMVSDTTTESKYCPAADGASWFVTHVQNEQKVTRARWMTTGLGTYVLYVNGRPVGQEFLKPGYTHYAKTRRSFTYDITDAFLTQSGADNVLAAEVTPGWWADKIITAGGTVGMTGHKPAFRAVLELTLADGSTRLYGTDLEHWKAGVAGPVLKASIYDGERYDARQPMGYDSEDRLVAPEEFAEFKGEILPSEGAEIYLRPDLTLQPVKCYGWSGVEGKTEEAHGKIANVHEFAPGQPIVLKKGEQLVVDFGQNCAAVPAFTFSAPAGTVLTCLPGELLNDGNGALSRGMDGPEGSVHRLNLRIPDGIRLVYTFAAHDKVERYMPQHTFFGYRYLALSADQDVTLYSIVSIPVSSITAESESGILTTGNKDVNRLIQNTLWGMRSNYLSVPTDCPQRNERLGWTADTQVFSETGTFFANTYPFMLKWMRDMRDTQSDKGGFPGVAPWGQYGSDDRSMMRVGWADAGVIVPWTLWKQMGDTRIIDENWEAMMRYITHVADNRYDHVALSAENGNYQWADWLSYEPLESCGGGAFGAKGPLPDAITYWNYLSASYWIIDAEMMRDMAAATGRDTAPFDKMIAEARDYTKRKFLKADGAFITPIFNSMQTPALFALRNGLVEGKARDRMIERLRQNFNDHGDCLQTGFLGTSILMPTLTACGLNELAYSLLLQHKNPSWLYSVDNGATTVWERWNSYMIEKGMGPRGMNSFNHYAYGCVCQWLWETAAGIAADTRKPGFRHIIMSPVPDRRLGSIEAHYRSAAGMIDSEWHFEGDQWVWTFSIPEGTTATVTLPGDTESNEYEAGKYTLRK